MKFHQSSSPLIEAEELLEVIDRSNQVILDVSPSGNKSGLMPKHPDAQIEGALKVDLKTHFSRRNTVLPNMAPSPEAFAEQLRLLDIDRNTDVIIYDKLGIYTAPRLWWLFRTMGHERVRVLNGGLDAWIEVGGKVEEKGEDAAVWKVETLQPHDENSDMAGKVEIIQTHYHKNYATWSRADIQSNLQSAEATVVDARSAGRFTGDAPEPRPGWPSGHIPQSVNIPFKTLLSGGKYLPAEVLKKKLSVMISPSGPLVFSCGSGLTACIVLLATALVSPDRDLYLYDGSWVEWADPQGEGCPIATG
ncbi:MAG: sulfurtransferase [Bacteroidota bacterium]